MGPSICYSLPLLQNSEEREKERLNGKMEDANPDLTSFDDDDVTELSSLEYQELLTSLFPSTANEIISGYSEIGSLGNDYAALVQHLKGEQERMEQENAEICEEIKAHSGKELNLLESGLEELKCSLASAKSENLKHVDSSTCEEHQRESIIINENDEFEMMELDDQVEKNEIILKSLQNLERLEVTEQTEYAMQGLRILDFEENRIKLSLRTCIPNLEGLACQLKAEDISNKSEVDHELLAVIDGADLKHLEIFPNDVYLGEIFDAAKSSRSLKWLVSKVHHRIIICTLRRYVVQAAPRHYCEYSDQDEMIMAHMAGRVDAFIKASQGWPILSSALKLISLRSSDKCSKDVSLSFLCKVEELANSLDISVRLNISSFVEAIETILVQQMHLEAHSGDKP